jgi:hypothetical protein
MMNLKSQIDEKNKSMQTYKVDLDYESYLFDENYKEDSTLSKKVISEFEYVFFLVNKDPCRLRNCIQYDQSYLNTLKTLGFYIPEFDPHAKKFQYWWSHRHELNIEKICNSKLTSAQIGKNSNWGFYQGAIVEKFSEVKIHIEKFPKVQRWIIKSANSFSGIGHYQFSVENLNEEKVRTILKSKMLLEPLYERVFDIGSTFVIDNGVIKDFFMVENYNSASGRFRGGAGASNADKFKQYIKEKYQFDLGEYEKITNLIAKKYIELGALYNIQIDSFIYKEDHQFKLYPLVEVNYRKTMGLVIDALAKKYSKAPVVEWLLYTQKELKDLSLDNTFIRVSPPQKHFQSFIHPIY